MTMVIVLQNQKSAKMVETILSALLTVRSSSAGDTNAKFEISPKRRNRSEGSVRSRHEH